MSALTVIMPAAGKGTRLNLPYPKEILRLDKEQALIDFSFDHFRDYGRKDVEFIIVINEDKTDIVKYLSKYKDKFNISFVYQNPAELEYTGAIKSARHLFGKNNIVLLPDTIMTLYPNHDLGATVLKRFEQDSFAFFYKTETEAKMLSTKGALKITYGKVEAYLDKPSINDAANYNAFWCSFAFQEHAFDQAINYMDATTLRKSSPIEFKHTPLYHSMGIEVQDYQDLGTWDEIRRLLRDTI